MENQHTKKNTTTKGENEDQPVLLEVKLDGSHSFGWLLELLHEEFKIDLSIKKGFVNYHEGENYGKIVFLIRDSRLKATLLADLLHEFYGIPAQLLNDKTMHQDEKNSIRV